LNSMKKTAPSGKNWSRRLPKNENSHYRPE
jgi:hypothetical protein